MSSLGVMAGIAQGLNQSSNRLIEIMAARYKMQLDKKQHDEDMKLKTRELDLMEKKYTNEYAKEQAQAEFLKKILSTAKPENISYSYGGVTIKPPDVMTPYQAKELEFKARAEEKANIKSDLETNKVFENMAINRLKLKYGTDPFGNINAIDDKDSFAKDYLNELNTIRQQYGYPAINQPQQANASVSQPMGQVNTNQNLIPVEIDGTAYNISATDLEAFKQKLGNRLIIK